MPGLDPSLRLLAHGPVQTATAAAHDTGGFSLHTAFHDLLDIVNPLQHLPVVGTLYRAITGDTIGTVEKIAGDTLYGGLWGAVSSVADTAFEAATGKDFGATVLALFTGDHDNSVKVAATAPTQAASQDMAALVSSISSPSVPMSVTMASSATPAAPAATADVVAFTSALNARGMDPGLAARALYAYRQTQGMNTTIN